MVSVNVWGKLFSSLRNVLVSITARCTLVLSHTVYYVNDSAPSEPKFHIATFGRHQTKAYFSKQLILTTRIIFNNHIKL